MTKRNWCSLFLLVLTTGASAAGPEPKYKAPRTESGQPDLRGAWNFSSAVPLERPSAFADKKLFTPEELEARKAAKSNALRMISKFAPVEDVSIDWLDFSARIENLRTSLIAYPENGRLPKLVEGVGRVPGADEIIEFVADAKGTIPPALGAFLAGGKKDGPEDFGAAERCLFGGGPPLMPDLDNNYVEVIQSKDHVVLRTERKTRIVPLDGRPHLSDRLRSWAGDSRGHWEGESLVVETRNFNNRTRSFAGAGNSREKVVTERFTRVAKNALEYEATIIDTRTFQDKVVMSYPMAKVDTRIYELGCHEGNYSMFNMLSGARKEEAEKEKEARK